MKESTISRFDLSDMRSLLLGFPEQVEDAIALGRRADVPAAGGTIANIILTGLGGSAIGGDILRSYLAAELRIPFIVNRHYFLPEFVGTNSLVIVGSYSGSTEETIAAHEDARKRGARILCVTSNGETERLAKKYGHALVKIPKGYPPRAALGYAFFPVLMAFVKMKLVVPRDRDLRETVALLRKNAQRYARSDQHRSDTNAAFRVARQIYNRLPIIYSSADCFDAVNLRWRGQLAENAKVLAFGNVLPEMNHNELVGWRVLKRHMEEMVVIFLRDGGEQRSVQMRMEITKNIVSDFAGKVVEVVSEGNSLLARLFSLVYLGDWVSFHLAMLNGVDPTPVKVIDFLKNRLSAMEHRPR